MDGPAHQVFPEYPSLLGTMESICEDHSGQWKYGDLLEKLSNVETLLMLAAILPMLEEMRNNMKKIQKRYMYIAEYNTVRKMTCVALDNLYRDSDSFALDEKLSGWMRITDLDNPDNFLKIDANGELCASIRVLRYQCTTMEGPHPQEKERNS